MSYRIGTLVRLTGISRNTITAWERRYGLLNPTKDASGYRTYSDEDVSLLNSIKAKLDDGFQIREAIAMARTAPPPAPRDDRVVGELLGAFLQFDRERADQLNGTMLEWSFRQRIDEVYLPVLRQIGERWEKGTASVAQEHFASGFVREKLTSMLEQLESGPTGGQRVICAGFPGEHHEIGLLAVAVKLALRGQRVTWLGANLPLDELITVANARGVVAICQSVIFTTDHESVYAHARALREAVDPKTLIVLGGPGVERLQERSTDAMLFCPEFEALLDNWDAVRTRTLKAV